MLPPSSKSFSSGLCYPMQLCFCILWGMHNLCHFSSCLYESSLKSPYAFTTVYIIFIRIMLPDSALLLRIAYALLVPRPPSYFHDSSKVHMLPPLSTYSSLSLLNMLCVAALLLHPMWHSSMELPLQVALMVHGTAGVGG